MFEARVGGTAVADSTLAEVLGEIDPYQFWTRAEEKLRSGHIRMLFVADSLPAGGIAVAPVPHDSDAFRECITGTPADCARVFPRPAFVQVSRSVAQMSG